MTRRWLILGALGAAALGLGWWGLRAPATATQVGTYTPLPTLTPRPGARAAPAPGEGTTAPLLFPTPMPRPPAGETLDGVQPPTVLATPRTDADIRAYVEDQLTRVKVTSGTPRIVFQRAVPPGTLTRHGLQGADDGHQVVIVAACDCDASPLLMGGYVAQHGAQVQYLVWVADRRYPGASLAAGPDGPWVQALLAQP